MKKRLAIGHNTIIAAPLILLFGGVFAAENKTLVTSLFDSLQPLA